MTEKVKSGNGPLYIVIGLIVAVVIGFFVWYFFTGSPAEDDTVPISPAQEGISADQPEDDLIGNDP